MQGEFLLPKFGSSARDLLPGDLCSPDSVIVIGPMRWRIQGGVRSPDWFLPLVLFGSIGERLTGCHIGLFAHLW